MSRHAGRWKEGMDARCKNGFYVAELVSPNLSHPFSVLDFGSKYCAAFRLSTLANHELFDSCHGDSLSDSGKRLCLDVYIQV
jgi:hypothetical protein